jgi:hypothetical protein
MGHPLNRDGVCRQGLSPHRDRAAARQRLEPEIDFQNPTATKPSSDDSQNLKFERADWTLFRTVEGLSQKAGVPPDNLTRLVLKELADNGLDAGAKVTVGQLPSGGYFVEDDGPGIDGTPEAIARLFSISRPLVSSKLLRLPTRGALGNGLRVVTGAVLASAGSLIVITRDRRIKLRPERDGTTVVIGSKAVAFPVGTRVEIAFGPALPRDPNALRWAQTACRMARGQTYAGKSSPWWYDVTQFHELLDAAGNMPVRELISQLDGCTGAKAGEIVTAAGLARTICSRVTRAQAERLLLAARAHVHQVTPKRLGGIGPGLYPGAAYACAYGIAPFGAIGFRAQIPYAVEAWAEQSDKGPTVLGACVNRTPVSNAIEAARNKRDIDAFGCGLASTIAKAPAESHFAIQISLITPFMPITSDGKEPNLRPFINQIAAAVAKAVHKAYRPKSGNGTHQIDVVLAHLDAAIAKVSGDGKYRFNQRQLLYALRPVVKEEMDASLKTGNFTAIITDYEAEHGEIAGMYREPRPSNCRCSARPAITDFWMRLKAGATGIRSRRVWRIWRMAIWCATRCASVGRRSSPLR